MTQDTQALPKFFKDAEGYCYIATPLLAKQADLTVWNGAVNPQGFAVAEAPQPTAKPEAKPPVRSRTKASE